MRRSKAEIYLHFVWAVSNRMPLLDVEAEGPVHRCIQAEARRLGCEVLAIGGMPDHVHLLIKIPARLSASEIMKQAKGVSSRFVHDQLPGHEALYWQEGYGVFSVTPGHVSRVKAYVLAQKEHHNAGALHNRWEETDEEAPT